MEGFHFTPLEYTQETNNLEQPRGQGTIEANNSGKLETRNDEETKERKLRFLKLLLVLEMLKQLNFRELLAAVLSQLKKST